MRLITGIFLAFVLVGLPLLAWSTKRQLDKGFVFPKIPFYVQSIILQAALLAWALFALRAERLPLGSDPAVRLSEVAVAALLLLLAIVAMRFSWRRSARKTRERILAIVPGTRRERMIWIGVSAAAAFGEEIVYRGALIQLLEKFSGSWLSAALVASIAFGLAHAVQGWANTVYVGLFGFAFHLLVLWSGDLAGAIAVHFLYDMITGYLLGRDLPP
jgi:membrane protease YdiL (CAAX protease family)